MCRRASHKRRVRVTRFAPNTLASIDAQASRYELLEGVPELLQRLAAAGYELHAFSNYPVWWLEIETRLRLSQLLPWTFLSCQGPTAGRRKPEPAAFEAAARHLGVASLDDLLLVDDQRRNVEAAQKLGLQAVQFQSAAQLEQSLQELGLRF